MGPGEAPPLETSSCRIGCSILWGPPPPQETTPAKRKNQTFLSVEAFISAHPGHQLSLMQKSSPALQLQESWALAAGAFPIWCGLCCRSVEAHKMHNAKYLVQHCSTNGHKNALAKAFQVLSGRSDAATIRGAMGGTMGHPKRFEPRCPPSWTPEIRRAGPRRLRKVKPVSSIPPKRF